MQCELPICALYVDSMKEAAAALGWTFEPLVYPSAEPGKGLTTALQKNPDYIVITGTPLSVIKPQVKEAHEQGVPLIAQSQPERPSPEGYASMSLGSQANEGEMLGSWMIHHANGEAHTVGLNLPLYPILGTETKAIEKLYGESCPGCTYEDLNLTPEDIGSGGVPQKVVAYLQSHPDTNYVYCTFSDLSNGLSAALKAAGYGDKVKILAAAANAAIVQEIPDKIAAAVSTPYPWLAWSDIDAAARLSVGDEISKEYQDQVWEGPAWVIDSKKSVESLAPTNYEWAGPGNGSFKREFEELWKVR
jgi:ribose transport system substrate-binding protein